MLETHRGDGEPSQKLLAEEKSFDRNTRHHEKSYMKIVKHRFNFLFFFNLFRHSAGTLHVCCVTRRSVVLLW